MVEPWMARILPFPVLSGLNDGVNIQSTLPSCHDGWRTSHDFVGVGWLDGGEDFQGLEMCFGVDCVDCDAAFLGWGRSIVVETLPPCQVCERLRWRDEHRGT